MRAGGVEEGSCVMIREEYMKATGQMTRGKARDTRSMTIPISMLAISAETKLMERASIHGQMGSITKETGIMARSMGMVNGKGKTGRLMKEIG